MYDKNAELFHRPITCIFGIFNATLCCCCCSTYPETVPCKILVWQIGSLLGQPYVMHQMAMYATVEPRYSKPLKCGHLILTDIFAQEWITFPFTPIHYNP